jgi:hypothetical protein
MNSVQLLRDQLKSAHDTQEATIADLSQDSTHFKPEGDAIPAGAAYVHSVVSEDLVLSSMIMQKTPISDGVSVEDMGLSEKMPGFDAWDKHKDWYKSVKIDLNKFKKFAKEVYAETDKYLESLSEEDLDKEIDRPVIGKQTLAFFITNFIILHIANLTGEISAAKGLQGLKGYPF